MKAFVRPSGVANVRQRVYPSMDMFFSLVQVLAPGWVHGFSPLWSSVLVLLFLTVAVVAGPAVVGRNLVTHVF